MTEHLHGIFCAAVMVLVTGLGVIGIGAIIVELTAIFHTYKKPKIPVARLAKKG